MSVNFWPQLSAPLEDARYRIISHGGGVQTSAMCLMAARGEIGPMPDMAFFADTGGEPAKVYSYLDWLRDQVPFPIHLVKRDGPSLAELAIEVANGRERKGVPLPPWYLITPDGPAMLPKQCSAEFKRDVVVREVRKLLGLQPGERGPSDVTVEVWIGMTTDELFRVGSVMITHGDSGSAARFFYCNHPTVKPVALMRWLVRLVTPKGGTVLDPFMGSGSTMIAADQEQFHAIGCELDPDYIAIASDRIRREAGLFADLEVC